jgi:peptidoglycan/LPS O-acetylase OafA/YrhL
MRENDACLRCLSTRAYPKKTTLKWDMPANRPILPAATQPFDTSDVLRGFSILAVVLLHTWLRFFLAGYDIRRPSLPHMAFHLIFLNGGNGVTVFFAVSGFLITLTSLRRFGSLSAMRASVFYRIRFARIAPLLVLIVAILSALALAHVEGFQFSPKNAALSRAIVSAFTFHLNWLEARFGYLPANWDVMWSLSVEEMFYIFFPIFCVVLLRFRRGMIPFIAFLLALVAMGPFARGVWSTNPIWLEKSYLGGMDGIALGCLTALLTHYFASRETGLCHSWALTPVSADCRCDDNRCNRLRPRLALEVIPYGGGLLWNAARRGCLPCYDGQRASPSRREFPQPQSDSSTDPLVWKAQL